MYKVLKLFLDIKDNNQLYRVGDTYPRKGYEPTQDRIKQLSGNKNAMKEPLIKEEKQKAVKEKKE